MMRVHTSRANRGATLIEFALIAVLLMLVIFACVEFARMLLVYTTLANSARAGCRYAITHGSDYNPPAVTVETVVRDFASAGLLNTANLSITVTPNPPGAAGSRVDVKVVYKYDPFTVLPLNVNLGSTSSGTVTF